MFSEYEDIFARKFANVKVYAEHYPKMASTPWPGKHRNVKYWVELVDGHIIGLNKNPTGGYSFPVLMPASRGLPSAKFLK